MDRPFNRIKILLTISLVCLLIPQITAKILKDDKLVYKTLQQNVTYVSSTSYHAKGMGPLYKSTNQVLHAFIGKEAIPEGYIIVSTDNPNIIEAGPHVDNNEWLDLAKHYWGILLVVCFSTLLIVLMPIIGLFFCCCRCAGACGGRSQPFDKKHDTCRRVILGVLVFGVATALLFGVVVAFVTNSYMQYGIENATTTLREGIDDTSKFLKSTSLEINHLLVTNYADLNRHLNAKLDETSEIVIEKLDNTSKSLSLEQLKTFVDILPSISLDLDRMTHLTAELRLHASQLNDGLRGVKRELLISLTECKADECREVLDKYQIGKLDANEIDYNKLPDVTDIKQDVENYIGGESSLAQLVAHGTENLENAKNELQENINANIPGIKVALTEAGNGLTALSREITTVIDRLSTNMDQNTFKPLEDADKYIAEYSIYRYYVGLGISSVLLLVLLCLSFGLLCGICGKRPGGYGDDCCNKGAGGKFLMLGVAVIFLTISILTLATLAFFLIGLIVQRGVCTSLRDPTGDQIFGYIDNAFDLNDFIYPVAGKSARGFKNRATVPPFRISQIIDACHENKSIYKVLQMDNIVNIDQVLNYEEEYGIEGKLNQLLNKIELTDNVQLLSEDARKEINSLSQSKLNEFSVEKFDDNLKENITNQNLNEIADKLIITADKIKSRAKLDSVHVVLKNQALHLRTYQANLVEPMISNTKELLEKAHSLDKNLKFGSNSFDESIKKLLEEIDEAELFINDEGTDFVKAVAVELIDEFKSNIVAYLQMVVRSTTDDVGKCGPISNVYDSILVGGCNRIVDPFNGFWAGVGWCILFFLPAIILCSKLSTLYQKSDPYPGPMIEAEYMYDAYSERDNIPLANGPKNKRRKKNDRRGSRERRDYYEDSSSSHGAQPHIPSGSRDTRYNDMAPKHWEGGPPRYQSPPIAPPDPEYERPPPYYFPGTANQPE